jgi:hypothetical protein
MGSGEQGFTNDDDRRWSNAGSHQMRAEEPDLFFIRFRGDLAAAEVAQIIDAIQRRAAERGPLLVLHDISALGDMPVETRKVVAQSDVLDSVAEVVYIGGSFVQRIAVMLGVSAARLGMRKKRFPSVHFFATDAEARVWLEERRRAPPAR